MTSKSKSGRNKYRMAAGAIMAALLGGVMMNQLQERKTEQQNVPSIAEEPLVAQDATTPDIKTDLSKTAVPDAVPETTSERLEREAFATWRKSEAAKIDSTKVNEDFEVTQLQGKIKTMKPSEWREVARQITDTAAPANERVISAYIMGQGGMDSELSMDLATQALSKPLPNPGPHPVHSTDETEALKEKSLRLLIVDEMIEQVKKDSRRRAALNQLIASIDDSSLRAMAERRLREEGL